MKERAGTSDGAWRKAILVLFTATLFSALMSCQTPPSTGGPQPASTPEPAVPDGARPLVEMAKADLSRRKGLPVEQVKVVSVDQVEWPNGSLGFPKPGTMYIQVLIPGYRIILTDGANTYEYHTDKGNRIEHGD